MLQAITLMAMLDRSIYDSYISSVIIITPFLYFIRGILYTSIKRLMQHVWEHSAHTHSLEEAITMVT